MPASIACVRTPRSTLMVSSMIFSTGPGGMLARSPATRNRTSFASDELQAEPRGGLLQFLPMRRVIVRGILRVLQVDRVELLARGELEQRNVAPAEGAQRIGVESEREAVHATMLLPASGRCD